MAALSMRITLHFPS
ncbi:hypothetical protein E2C01_049371 [Portunus trituberculatus]|uniref:Uncharacterized protein n=1 Tax=Portunus trituberculatus TaxID=210409 RepID=A0A5B7GDQ5_PORTR|nr:hypothetical protein [Portunus trituberculatus]